MVARMVRIGFAHTIDAALEFESRQSCPLTSANMQKDAYLMFKRSRVRNKSYIIRYDAPCT